MVPIACGMHRGELKSVDVRAWEITACLFALSFGTALFALGVFKLLSFFIMPSLFFDLLFIGFPLGALIGARFFAIDIRSLRRVLGGLQMIMAASVVACLLAKRFDYLRAHLYDVEVLRLAGQIGIFAGLFMPFFAAYGMCEYLGYQVGRRHLQGRMRLVYAVALFGAAAAYLALKNLLPLMGMVGILASAFAAIAMASMMLHHGCLRWLFAFEVGALLACSSIPGVEPAFLHLYKGKGKESTWNYVAHEGCRPVFQKWGRYSLCEILEDPVAGLYYGFYNDMFQWEYKPRMGFDRPSLGAIPILMSKPGQHLAIVGSGGGRQVRLAQKLGNRTITAIEIEPAVFRAVRSRKHLLRAFGGVYEAPGVIPVQGEARGYLERSRDRFDLIYLPSVGGYPQMMIEPGNMVRTFEAYRAMREHLTESGILAIWYPLPLDIKGILTGQYVQTLRALGLKTEAFRNDYEFLILGYRDHGAEIPSPKELAGFLRLPEQSVRTVKLSGLLPRPYPVEPDPDFVSITDQKPFLAGNVRYILSMSQVRQLFTMAGGLVGLAGIAMFWSLRRRGDPQLPGRTYPPVTALALLIGVNFIVVEHALVLSLFQRVYVYDDALTLGVVGFLTLSGLGSLAAGHSLRPLLLVLAIVGIGVFVIARTQLAVPGLFLVLAPVAMVTAAFFPTLFEITAHNPLAVFAFDAVGSGLGALAATFIPIAWGIDVFFWVAGAVFVVTVIADAWFRRGLGSPLLGGESIPRADRA